MTKIFLSPLPYLLLVQICSSKFDDIAVYLGQDSIAGSLKETWATGKYSFVVVNSISIYEYGETVQDRCDPFSSSGCPNMGSEIKYCQQQGIKVMFSLGASSVNYTLLSSSDGALKVFDYLWNKFLGGSSSSRPFGDAILDGIDFSTRSTALYLDDLARYLKLRSTDTQKLYLSASPQCSFPDDVLAAALDTGVFDYVWVQFYENPSCEYSEANTIQFVKAWDQWPTSLYGSKSKIFPGLPASQEIAISGYVPTDLLISEVLPTVNKSSKYGGVMLWSSYEDRLSGYSTYLQLCAKPRSAPKCRNHDNGFEERLGYMYLIVLRFTKVRILMGSVVRPYAGTIVLVRLMQQ